MDGKITAQKWRHALKLDALPPSMRRLIVGIIGGTVLLVGVALIFLPGPAVVVIPIGLAILASEFSWARHYLSKAKKMVKKKASHSHS
jgi:uncharacterized protein (TIGR02611 family)